jgi:hypothetical protein
LVLDRRVDVGRVVRSFVLGCCVLPFLASI